MNLSIVVNRFQWCNFTPGAQKQDIIEVPQWCSQSSPFRVQAVHRWFTHNGLLLNADKSEAIVCGTGARQRHEDEFSSIQLSDINIPVSGCVCSLGVNIDSTMSCSHHVDNVCKTSYYHIQALRCILRLTTLDDAKIVGTAVVSSRLEYCNVLLYDKSKSNIR
jgi:hypothetical protein